MVFNSQKEMTKMKKMRKKQNCAPKNQHARKCTKKNTKSQVKKSQNY
jgi:hypothetical protein